jgi:Domain of unknown function (DUF4432)
VGTVLGVDYDDLPRWVGQLSQVARIDSFTEDQGSARGARRLRLVTGGGLEVELHPDRALDIGQVTYRGMPVAWVSAPGITSPTSFDGSNTEWLRTFGGGLLATCGLDTFGPPSVHRGVCYGLHGRIGRQPARLLVAEVACGALSIVAESRQAAVSGENLILRRTVTADVGGSRLRISDTVTNEGWTDAGHMLLYHCNLGWPLISDAATLVVPSAEIQPRDAEATAGLADWARLCPPIPGFREQVFCHTGLSNDAVVAVDNSRADLRLELRFSVQTLPALVQWKMTGEGEYVLGLEPANVGFLGGRARAAEACCLPILPARSSVDYWIEFKLSPSGATDVYDGAGAAVISDSFTQREVP